MSAQAQMRVVAPVPLVVDVRKAVVRGRGAGAVCARSDEAYMMREYQVRDPDGHLLASGHDISGQQANG